MDVLEKIIEKEEENKKEPSLAEELRKTRESLEALSKELDSFLENLKD